MEFRLRARSPYHFLGYDENGNPKFENTRSEVGELLFRLKYRDDRSALPKLAEASAAFVEKWAPGIDALVPVTPSRVRAFQPTLALAAAIAADLKLDLGARWIERKENVPELKNVTDHEERIRLLKGAHIVDQGSVKDRKILVFDDLFQTGATMNAVTGALYDQGGASKLFALTITRAGPSG